MPPMRTEYHAALGNAKLDIIRFGALADDAIRFVAGTQDVAERVGDRVQNIAWKTKDIYTV
jgi:hypothetical protein